MNLKSQKLKNVLNLASKSKLNFTIIFVIFTLEDALMCDLDLAQDKDKIMMRMYQSQDLVSITLKYKFTSKNSQLGVLGLSKELVQLRLQQ
jgi:hypothetical protein